MVYKKKKILRRRRLKKSVWKKLNKLSKQVSATRDSVTPWNHYFKTDGTAISPVGENQFGWVDFQWGTILDWNLLWNAVPRTKINTLANLAGTNVYNVLDMQMTYPDNALTGDQAFQNTKLTCIHTMSFEMRNNQAFPMYIQAYKWVTRDSYRVDAEDTNPTTKYRSFTDCMKYDLTQSQWYNTELANETQGVYNPAFHTGMISGKFKGTWKQYYKVQKVHKFRIDPGQTIHISHTNKFHLSWKELNRENVGADAGGSFFSGRMHGITFRIRGCVGIASFEPDPSPGFMDGTIQMVKTEKFKYRLSNGREVPTIQWRNPTNMATSLLAIGQPATVVSAEKT